MPPSSNGSPFPPRTVNYFRPPARGDHRRRREGAGEGTSEYPFRVVSLAGTDCHRPFHVFLLILDQRSKQKKKKARAILARDKRFSSSPPPITLPAPHTRTRTHIVANIDITLPARDILRYIFSTPFPPFVRSFLVIRFITPSITRHSY